MTSCSLYGSLAGRVLFPNAKFLSICLSVLQTVSLLFSLSLVLCQWPSPEFHTPVHPRHRFLLFILITKNIFFSHHQRFEFNTFQSKCSIVTMMGTSVDLFYEQSYRSKINRMCSFKPTLLRLACSITLVEFTEIQYVFFYSQVLTLPRDHDNFSISQRSWAANQQMDAEKRKRLLLCISTPPLLLFSVTLLI